MAQAAHAPRALLRRRDCTWKQRLELRGSRQCKRAIRREPRAEVTQGLASRVSDRIRGGIRSLEGKWIKLMPMTVLFFSMSFVNALLDSTKDTLVVTAMGGAEQIPYLTVFAVLPCSFLAVAAFSWMAGAMSRERLFVATVATFGAFFVLFGFFLYPNRNIFHPHALVDSWEAFLPAGLHGAAEVVRNWLFTLFYISSELWGDVVLAFLFWGLANEITKLDEASVLYPLFGVGANVAQVLAGRILKWLGLFIPSWEGQLKALCALSGLAVGLILTLHGAIVSLARKKAWGEDRRAGTESVQKERKSNFSEGLTVLMGSVQIRCLAIMAASQGLASNVFQVAWKGQLRLLYPDPAKYSAFMGDVASAAGLVTIFFMLCAPVLFNRLGWRGAASFAPRAMLGLGSIFFLGAICATWLSLEARASSLLAPMVAIGAALYVLEKAARFSFFKPAEEMVYISLSENERTRGKAAVDIIGGQVGKAGGSALLQGLLISLGTIVRALPALWMSHLSVIVAWLKAIRNIDSTRGPSCAVADEPASASVDAEEERIFGDGDKVNSPTAVSLS